MALAADPEIDAVIELMGGSEGVALDLTRKAAVAAGKSVITANKALLAHHGAELAALAEANGATIGYEAAVAGGIPIVKALSARASPAIASTSVYGILNGTCNYILTTMRETGRGLSRTCSRRRRSSAMPKPIRPSTSTASTPRTSWRFWPRSPYGCPPRFRRRSHRRHSPCER